jgi:uncharacterized protein
MTEDIPLWFEAGLRFSCQPGCVRCCGGAPGDVFVTDGEIRAIAACVKTPVAEFESQSVRHYSSGKTSLEERPNGDCVLLNGKGCTAYAVRPRQCRDYPFWPEILADAETWLREARRCPGINSGELRSAEAIQAILAAQLDAELAADARMRT